MRTAQSAFIVIIATLLMFSSAHAAKLAIIKSGKAKVYSDAELKSPIGTLKKGTKIKIGERFRYQGTVAYTEIQERLVYIKVSDLRIQGSKDIELEETSRFRTQALLAIEKELLAPEHYVSVNAGISKPGEKWQELARQMETDPNNEFRFVEIQVENFFENKLFAVMVGAGYVENTDPNLKLSMTTLHAKLHFIPVNIKLASLHLFGGVIGSPWMVIETENGQYFTKGSSIGGMAGGEVRLFPGKKFTLGIGSSIQYQTLYGHGEIQRPGPYKKLTGIYEYNEIRTYANFAMKF